jgi:hypothetical protein
MSFDRGLSRQQRQRRNDAGSAIVDIVSRMTWLDFIIYVLIALIVLCLPFAYEVYADVRLPWLFTNGPAFVGLLAAWWIIARRIKK